MTAPATSDNTTGLDYFLYGMALANHSTCLRSKWESPACGAKVVAYLAGMGEHLCYMVCKVLTFVCFIFLNLALLVHYLSSVIQRLDEGEKMKRQIRLLVGLLVLAETVPGACVDAVGILCPPLAYEAHSCLKQQVTRRCFEKWGIVDHSMSNGEFDSLNYFSKI